MALPISKSALDRLGVRLAAGEDVSDSDLVELARVVDAYQHVLNGVKLKLAGLGYRATSRMKTTGTLVDKLRRESARLSQIQDLAGARIVVSDRSAQDEVKDHITAAFTADGCTLRESNRLQNPSHGYRAFHLVVYVEKVPVEIQIRTELQDGWAQIVERLADVWGRGIRYGGEPDAPDTMVGTGTAMSRRDVLALLMRLSDTIARVEERQVSFSEASQNLESALSMAETLEVPPGARDLIVGDTMPENLLPIFEQSIQQIQDASSEVGSLLEGWQRMTIAQLAEATRATVPPVRRHRDSQGEELRSLDASLRAILTQLVDAIGLG